MTDEKFDSLAREALAYDAGQPSEAVWRRVHPIRASWLPTVREILVCGSVCGCLLLGAHVWVKRDRSIQVRQNPVIQAALQDETQSALNSVTRIPGSASS